MNWDLADKISDRIVDLINDERSKPGFSPLQAFAGQMLAMLALLETAPANAPAEFHRVEHALFAALRSMRGD